jgi:hypothetical protein
VLVGSFPVAGVGQPVANPAEGGTVIETPHRPLPLPETTVRTKLIATALLATTGALVLASCGTSSTPAQTAAACGPLKTLASAEADGTSASVAAALRAAAAHVPSADRAAFDAQAKTLLAFAAAPHTAPSLTQLEALAANGAVVTKYALSACGLHLAGSSSSTSPTSTPGGGTVPPDIPGTGHAS